MKKWVIPCLCLVLVICIGTAVLLIPSNNETFGYARSVDPAEKEKREQILAAAKTWLGCKEADGSFKPIIDLYNSHEPLAVDYTVKYTDKWCATFVSTVSIQCGMTDILPTECGCQRQIALFETLGRWEESDTYIPLPGDVIYYSSAGANQAENTGWSDHVGIVAGTSEHKIQVIEGNYLGAVQYHYISFDDPTIRGYGLPDYSA